MSRLLYPLIYCLLLVGIFTGLSVAFYSTPSQRAHRLQETLRDAVGVDVAVREANVQGYLLQGHDLVLSAPSGPVARIPVVEWWEEQSTTIHPNWVNRLAAPISRSFETNGPSNRSDAGAGLPLPKGDEAISPRAGASAPFFRCRAPSAELTIGRYGPSDGGQPSATPTWNLAGLANQVGPRLRANWNLQMTIGSVTVRLDPGDAVANARPLPDLSIEKFELVRPTGREALAIRGRLGISDAGKGRFEALLERPSPERALTPSLVRLQLRELAGIEAWLTYLPLGLQRFEKGFRPRGKVSLELDRRVLTESDGAVRATVNGTVHHRGSRLHVSHLDLDLADVTGPVDFDDQLTTFGLARDRMRGPLHARVDGHIVSLTGSCGRVTSHLSVLISRTTTANLLGTVEHVLTGLDSGASAVAQLLRDFMGNVGMSGDAAGEMCFRWTTPQGQASWELAGSLTGRRPAARALAQTFEIGIEAGSTEQGGTWIVDLSGTRLRGLGELRGKVHIHCNHADNVCQLEVRGLRLGSRGHIHGAAELSLVTGRVTSGTMDVRNIEFVDDEVTIPVEHARVQFQETATTVELEFGSCRIDGLRVSASGTASDPSGGAMPSLGRVLSDAQVTGELTDRGLEIRHMTLPSRSPFATEIFLGWDGSLEGQLGPLPISPASEDAKPVSLRLSGSLSSPRARAVPAVAPSDKNSETRPASSPSTP